MKEPHAAGCSCTKVNWLHDKRRVFRSSWKVWDVLLLVCGHRKTGWRESETSTEETFRTKSCFQIRANILPGKSIEMDHSSSFRLVLSNIWADGWSRRTSSVGFYRHLGVTDLLTWRICLYKPLLAKRYSYRPCLYLCLDRTALCCGATSLSVESSGSLHHNYRQSRTTTRRRKTFSNPI